MTANDLSSRQIQGLGIAGFGKDHLLGVPLEDLKKAGLSRRDLSRRTASASEVRQFDELFSEMRNRGAEDESYGYDPFQLRSWACA
jgi:hypothetical protein